MAARLTSLLPRVVALTAIFVLASATISFAAETTLRAPQPKVEASLTTPPLVTVPDVAGQAYVFAKSTLEESGFAWRVTGSVKGYPANSVVSQSPAAGTRVVDTGLPTVLLSLKRNLQYAQAGAPENSSPYTGTRIRLFVRPKAKPKPAVAPKPAAKPKPTIAPKPKPKARPKPAPKPKPRPKVQHPRTPAFTAVGAPKEPLDEITLPARALRLQRWLRVHPKPTNANVRHWLYQHEWIVTGARFGWWHGAEALQILLRIDEQVQRRWDIGRRSEAAARHALAAVRAKTR